MDLLSSSAHQPSILGEFLISKAFCLKTWKYQKKVDSSWGRTSNVSLWLSHEQVSVCSPTHKEGNFSKKDWSVFSIWFAWLNGESNNHRQIVKIKRAEPSQEGWGIQHGHRVLKTDTESSNKKSSQSRKTKHDGILKNEVPYVEDFTRLIGWFKFFSWESYCYRSRAELSRSIFDLLIVAHCPLLCLTLHNFHYQVKCILDTSLAC